MKVTLIQANVNYELFFKFNTETKFKLLIRIMLQDLKIFFTGAIDDCVNYNFIKMMLLRVLR